MRYVLFDLDGTLTDPFEGITNSVVYALKKFKIEVKDRRTLIPFIGPPLYESFEKFFGVNGDEAVGYFREYFSTEGLYENKVYDGIEEVLKTLKKLGKKLIVATSKPEVFSVRILKRFSLFEYFDFVCGATLNQERVKKADVIKYALECGGIKDKSQAVMVGDREHDILGAKQNGLKSVGVLYGYGSEAELSNAGADSLAATPKDILKFV